MSPTDDEFCPSNRETQQANIPPTVQAQYYGSGTYTVPCDAVPPTVEFGLGGKKFRIDPSSLILPETRVPEFDADYCTTGIARGSGTYILGDVFLQEMLVVFDVSDKKEMKFAQRVDK